MKTVPRGRLNEQIVQRHLKRIHGTLKASLLILILLALAGSGCKRSVPGAEERSMNESPISLELGVPIERQLAPGETLPFTLDLPLGNFVQITAKQQGIDVSLRWLAPEGAEPLLEVDSPNGEQGDEVLAAVAGEAGRHRLEVVASKEATKPGGVTVTLDVRNSATDQERRLAEGALRFASGENERRVARFDEALASYEGALGIFRKIGDQRCEAATLYRIGWVRQDAKQGALSVEPLVQAIRLYGILGDRFMEATALNRCGSVYLDLSRIEDALLAHRRATDIFRELKDSQGTVSSLTDLGLDQSIAGLVEDATASLRDAIVLADRFDRQEDEVLARIRLGTLLFERGDFSSARAELGIALSKAEAAKSPMRTAQVLAQLGAIDNREGKPVAARERFQKALDIFRELKSAENVLAARTGLGVALLRAGAPEEAKTQFDKVLEISQKLGDRYAEAVAKMNLGRYHHARGEDDQAVAEHRASLGLFEQLGDRTGIASNHFGMARSICHSGDLGTALREIEASLAEVEGIRGEVANFDLRTSYLASKREYGDLQVEILMSLDKLHPKDGYAARALAADERQRARHLLDLLGEARAKIRRDAPADLLAEEGRLRNELNGLDNLRSKLFREEAEPAVLGKVSTEETHKLARLGQVRAEIRLASPRFASLTEPETLDLAGMQKLLGAHDRLLIYRLGVSKSYLWAISQKGLQAYDLGPREPIERLANRYAALLASFDPERAHARREAGLALAKLILDPAKGSLSEGRLAVVADGALHRVPFAALPDPLAAETTDRPPLLVRAEVLHLPSATVLAVLRREGAKRLPALGGVAVFADPVFSPRDPRVLEETAFSEAPGAARGGEAGEYPRLPHTRREADAILKLLPPQLRFSAFDFAARRQAVLGDRLKRYRIIHFATHGQVDPVHPELSGLVFSQVDEQGLPIDGILRLNDIYDLDLTADLVVLSACSTGAGSQVPGEGLVSLTRGFLYAGVQRLVVSLWPVPDDSTADLMASFYRHLLTESRTPAAALRQAQLEMLDDPKRRDPFHWAAFTLVGDWRYGGPGTTDDSIETRDVGGPNPNIRPDIDLPPPAVEPPPGYEEEGGPAGKGWRW